METTVKALPNQSLLDIIIMEYGTLEAGMQFAFENDKDISLIPATGDEFRVPQLDAAITNTTITTYLKQNGITIGTKGIVPPLECTVVLKPVMHAVPSVTGNPHTIGYYSYNLMAAAGFINVHDLVGSYLSTNKVMFETEERYILGHPPATATELSATAMPDKSIPYKLNWTVGLGYMMVWSDPGDPVKTVTFKDIAGNEAYVSPIIILDNTTQDVVEQLIGDVAIDVVAASAEAVTIRLTRSHPPIFLGDYSNYSMEWLGDTATGTPDPYDPTNANKIVMTLSPGNYTLGVQTTYEYPGVTVYPPSAFTMVINVA
jgi:hypothetical protein